MRNERCGLFGNFFELLPIDERFDAGRFKTLDSRGQDLSETTGGNSDALIIASEPASSGHARQPPHNVARALRLPDDSVGGLREILPKLLEVHVIDFRMPVRQIQAMCGNRLPRRMIGPLITLLTTRGLGPSSPGLPDLVSHDDKTRGRQQEPRTDALRPRRKQVMMEAIE